MLFLLLLALASAVQSDTRVTLSATQNQYELSSSLAYLEDPSGGMALTDAQAAWKAGAFSRSLDDSLNFGFTDSAYWFRIELHNSSSSERDWVMEMLYPIMDQVEVFYRFDDGHERYQIAGDSVPFNERSRQNHHINYAFALAQGESVEVFLRAKTTGAVQMPLTLWSENAFSARDHNKQILFGLYYGLLLALAIYNFLIFLSVRDVNYLWYVSYIIFYGLLQASLNGLSYEYLWPDSPQWNNRSVAFLLSVAMFFILAFTRSFLALWSTAPRLNMCFKVAMALFAAFWVMNLVAPYDLAIRVSTLAAGTMVALIFATGVYCWWREFKPARYFMIAWTALLIGMTCYVLKTFGLLPANFITEYAIQIGSAIEVLLLSLALADRIRLLTDENRRIQNELTSELENRVRERTGELEEANRLLEVLNATDGLTGIHNRRHFNDSISLECKRASRDGPLSMLLLDIDHFKHFNDTYGHQAGDDCLTLVARTIAAAVQREADVVARYGGEEFAVIMPATHASGAMMLAESIRERIKQLPIAVADGQVNVTVSIGVTTTGDGARCDPEAVVKQADTALYAAKEEGRDRCVFCQGGSTQQCISPSPAL
ncbi:MAG: hypothetical protein CL583_02650 [Alteromonadaceae bacterium]|nr:hypothetical protein [Alteromonadaceae bacterium]